MNIPYRSVPAVQIRNTHTFLKFTFLAIHSSSRQLASKPPASLIDEFGFRIKMDDFSTPHLFGGGGCTYSDQERLKMSGSPIAEARSP